MRWAARVWVNCFLLPCADLPLFVCYTSAVHFGRVPAAGKTLKTSQCQRPTRFLGALALDMDSMWKVPLIGRVQTVEGYVLYCYCVF